MDVPACQLRSQLAKTGFLVKRSPPFNMSGAMVDSIKMAFDNLIEGGSSIVMTDGEDGAIALCSRHCRAGLKSSAL